MNDKTNTHNDLWWAEQNADVAKQTAVDAWRNGYTANTGPELPYTMWEKEYCTKAKKQFWMKIL